MTQTLVISLVVLAVIALVLKIVKVQKAEKIRMQKELEKMYPEKIVKTKVSEAIAVEAPVVVVDQEVVVSAKPKKRRKYKPRNTQINKS
jgi:hypothetical protein